MKQILYRVSMVRRKTKDITRLMVWAENNHEATHKLVALIGPDCEYRWTGTGPEHDEHGNLITREVEE